ncbi:16S rRNA (uracil(1498)-N(3))-methyltransferase [Candidatus Uhrbacteria bacterium]|nr:16S rRNA (uracil(1498)-N(3))-methyltransferase [Candidatus Uhrbacteria bacterium]
MLTARFFVPEEYIARAAEAFTIPAGPLHRQITTVLRMKVGDPIALLPNDGTEIDGRITDISRSAITGVIAGSSVPDPLLPEVTVCAALLKRENFELVLQKCTELGANAFIPLLTDRTIKKLSATPDRWRAIVREASEQCGRVRLPAIHDPMPFANAIGHTDGMRRIVLHEGDGETLEKVLGGATAPRQSALAIFIGPEGGFTDHELAVARDAKSHIVRLGKTVLRAETAAIAGLTLVRCR